jgi:uncharacterized membrane protein YeaQ/YmgE (transglycosylase-associated protein family)
MGFLAYFVIGGLVGWAAVYYFPGFSLSNKALKKQKRTKSTYFLSVILGVIGAIAASFGGQMTGLFTSGQMMEWGSAVLGGFLLNLLFLVLKFK